MIETYEKLRVEDITFNPDSNFDSPSWYQVYRWAKDDHSDAEALIRAIQAIEHLSLSDDFESGEFLAGLDQNITLMPLIYELCVKLDIIECDRSSLDLILT